MRSFRVDERRRLEMIEQQVLPGLTGLRKTESFFAPDSNEIFRQAPTLLSPRLSRDLSPFQAPSVVSFSLLYP